MWVAADRLCSFTADVTEQNIADVSLQPAPNFSLRMNVVIQIVTKVMAAGLNHFQVCYWTTWTSC